MKEPVRDLVALARGLEAVLLDEVAKPLGLFVNGSHGSGSSGGSGRRSFVLGQCAAADLPAQLRFDEDRIQIAVGKEREQRFDALGRRHVAIEQQDLVAGDAADAAFDAVADLAVEPFLTDLEKGYILEALRRTNSSQTKAADLLKMSVRSLRHLLDKYQLKAR